MNKGASNLVAIFTLCLGFNSVLFAAETSANLFGIELEPITVTAQKRLQPLKEVPIAISVVDQGELDQIHAHSLSEMQSLAPNFSVIQNGITKAISIRGVGGGGRNIGFPTRAGVYIDGVNMGQSPALEYPIYDVEQIEILRGPQVHLFGGNTDSGAVNIITRPPSSQFFGSYKTGIGNYSGFENVLTLDGPLSENLLGKVILSSETRDGYVTNVFDNSEVKNLDRLLGRVQLRYLASEQLRLDFSSDFANIRHTDMLPQAQTGLFDAPLANVLPKRQINYNDHPHAETEVFGANLKASYEMENKHMLTSITAFRKTQFHESVDNDYSPVNLLHTNFSHRYHQFSQELRIASQNDYPWRYVGGIYFEHEKAESNNRALFGSDTSTLIKLPAVPFPIPFDAAFGVLPGANVPVSGKINTNIYALFGAVDYDITKNVTLNLGARYTSERKDLEFNIDGTQSGAIGIATRKNHHDMRHDHFLSSTLGLTFTLSDNLSAYTKYTRGFKGGGWNVDFLSEAQVSDGFEFNKETVNSCEIGLKGESANRMLQYDLALFHNIYNDFQVFQFANLDGGQTVLQLRNAAKAKSSGIEVSARGFLTNQWSMRINAGLLDAHYVSFPDGASGGQSASGKRLPDAPRFSATIATDYTFHAPSLGGKFKIYLEDVYQSTSYSGLSSDQNISRLSNRNIVNFRTSYLTDNKHWELALWARNLFNKHYAKAKGRDFFGNQIVLYGDPIFYGATAQYNF